MKVRVSVGVRVGVRVMVGVWVGGIPTTVNRPELIHSSFTKICISYSPGSQRSGVSEEQVVL